MQSSLELARRRDAPSSVALALGWFGIVALPFVVAALPLSILAWLVGGGVTCAVVSALPWPKREAPVFPDDIADPVLRATFTAILGARTELAVALANAPGFASVSGSLNAQCDEAVRTCARVAPVANRLHAYLTTHDTWEIAREAAQLRVRANNARDQPTAHNLTQAAAACEQQVATCDDLTRTRDRIQSRLDNVLASLRAFTAAVIKQQTVEDEQVAIAGDSISEHVDGVRQELGALESALQLDVAA